MISTLIFIPLNSVIQLSPITKSNSIPAQKYKQNGRSGNSRQISGGVPTGGAVVGAGAGVVVSLEVELVELVVVAHGIA